MLLNPIALRKAKIVYNFGLSKCSRVKVYRYTDMFFFVVFFYKRRKLCDSLFAFLDCKALPKEVYS